MFKKPDQLRSIDRLEARRRVWLKIHLWLGLGVGALLALIGLTGAMLVFWHEIDGLLNPTLYWHSIPESNVVELSLDEIVATAERAAPAGWDSVAIDMPREERGNYVFGFYYPNNSPAPESAQSITIGVDPHSAVVTHRRVFYHGINPFEHSLAGFLFKLHYALLLGASGSIFVGMLAVVFLISALTGLILWWPLTGRWGRALTIKRRASIERLTYDLHQTAGFYSAGVLVVLLISGMYFNLPDQFRWLVECFSPLSAEPIAPVGPGQPVTSLDAALQKAREKYPDGIPHYYVLNNAPSAMLTACFKDVPELRRYVLAERCLMIARNRGALLRVQDAEHGSAGDWFMYWQWPLHSGQAFGWAGRIAVFLTGLACPVLFISGVVRWRHKRRAKR
ncbi:MAG: PepSY-associated TM helix domain-containing protein [Methylomonas sp.]|nr:PepSY-associated TM helix domain-containing protein [Methylomonas sp.]